MIKTLRITTVIFVILAGVMFVFPVMYGSRSNEEIEALLAGPTILEEFHSLAEKKTPLAQGKSPLVAQAEAFALFIDPPPAAAPPRQLTSRPREAGLQIPTPPVHTTAKFDLLGTSVNQADPKLSLAFINEPGKGMHWVWPGTVIGHLEIEQIRDGVVVVRDGQGSSEVAIKDPAQVASLITGAPSAAATIPGAASPSSIPGSPPSYTPAMAASRRITTPPAQSFPSAAGAAVPPRPRMSQEELADLGDRLKALHDAARAGSVEDGGEAEEIMKRLMGAQESDRLTPEETRKLDDLGRDLKSGQQGPNQPAPPTGQDPRAYRPTMPTRNAPTMPLRYQNTRKSR